MWSHEWGAPSVVVIRTPKGPLHTARQTCEVCGTSRNPFTLVLTYKAKGSSCYTRGLVGRERDHSDALERVRSALAAHRANGDLVDRDHDGRPAREEPPVLPLQYKD